MKLQKKTQMKQYNKEMQRHLNDSFNLKSYSKNAFKGFLLKVLRPEKLLREQSELEKISNKYINRQVELLPIITNKGAAPNVVITEEDANVNDSLLSSQMKTNLDRSKQTVRDLRDDKSQNSMYSKNQPGS